MDKRFVDPIVPFVTNIQKFIGVGFKVQVKGIALQGPNRFSINLQCGSAEGSDIGLHLSFRNSEGFIAMNTWNSRNGWEKEVRTSNLLLVPGQKFEIIISLEEHLFTISVNGELFMEFPHRMPFKELTHLLVDESVMLDLVSYGTCKNMNFTAPDMDDPSSTPLAESQ